MDQTKLDQSKLDYTTTVEKVKEKEKELDVSSFDGKDEEDQLNEK